MNLLAPAPHPASRHNSSGELPLVVRGLRKQYLSGSRPVVDGVSMSVARGEFVAVMGPSGSGKSTLLQMMGGLTQPTDGSVHIAGIEISRSSESVRARVRRRHVGYVFQSYNLIDELRIVDDIALPLRLNGVRSRRAHAEAVALLERLGLGERCGAYPAELSGGEQQRAAIARALIARPDIVLADEPTGALDSASAASMIGLLRQACDQGQTIVMVTHDHDVAAAADRTLHMADGTLGAHVMASATGAG